MLADAFQENRERLLNLAKRNMPPELVRILSPEDVVQETFTAACGKVPFIEKDPEIPIYFKLRVIFFQTLAGLERKYLSSQKRSLRKEVSFPEAPNNENSQAKIYWEDFAETMTSPLSKIVRLERSRLLHEALDELTEFDREILILRHFDGFPIKKCADSLGITPKAASMRHIRALQRLQEILLEKTEFR